MKVRLLEKIGNIFYRLNGGLDASQETKLYKLAIHFWAEAFEAYFKQDCKRNGLAYLPPKERAALYGREIK